VSLKPTLIPKEMKEMMLLAVQDDDKTAFYGYIAP
jgi:hypothetical protein